MDSFRSESLKMGWSIVTTQEDVKRFIVLFFTFQKRPQMALCRVKTGHLTWRSVTLSTRQKKGTCHFSKLWEVQEHNLHPAVLGMWGGAVRLGKDAHSLNAVHIWVFLLLRHFRKLLYDTALSVVGCLGRLAWKMYYWRGYWVRTSGVLVFSACVSFQCCNAMNCSHLNRELLRYICFGIRKAALLAVCGRTGRWSDALGPFWVAANLSCLITILPFGRLHALLWPWLDYDILSSRIILHDPSVVVVKLSEVNTHAHVQLETGTDSFSHSIWYVKSCFLKMVCFSFSPKDAIRALKKRLNGNKNYREVMLALTVSGGRLECLKRAEPFSFVIFPFLALTWMYTLFTLTATALPFSSLQLPPCFLGQSYWKLCIAFFWLIWYLLFSGLFFIPSTDWGKLKWPKWVCVAFGSFPCTLSSSCPVFALWDNSSGRICKRGWWTCHIFSFVSSWCTISHVNGSL